jgi:hypothetical protein
VHRTFLVVEHRQLATPRIPHMRHKRLVAVMRQITSGDRLLEVADRPRHRPRTVRQPLHNALVAVPVLPALDQTLDPMRIAIRAPHRVPLKRVRHRTIDRVEVVLVVVGCVVGAFDDVSGH